MKETDKQNSSKVEKVQDEGATDPIEDSSRVGKVNQIFQELEVMSLHKGSRGNLDLSIFDKEQKDKIIDIIAKNEENAIKYHTDRTNAIKEIELAKINAANTNNKTLRYLVIGGLILLVIVTVLILLLKESFFIPWLTFLTGFVGGTGVNRLFNTFRKADESQNPIQQDSDER